MHDTLHRPADAGADLGREDEGARLAYLTQSDAAILVTPTARWGRVWLLTTLVTLSALGGLDKVVEIRGRGLMLGIELSEDCPQLVKKALAQKLLINVTAGNTIRLLPPLIINETQARTVGCTVADLICQ